MNNQANDNTNRKEEILEKSRKSNRDEGVEYAKRQGDSIGRLVVFFAVCIPLSVISALSGHMSTVWALEAVSCAFWFGEVFAYYRFTKKKSYMIKTVCAALLLIAFVYWFIATVQGW